MADIPRTYKLHPSVPTEAREWLKYPVTIKTGYYGINGFHYFAEQGEPETMNDSTLGAELFNEALLRVDVTDEESLLLFVERFGLPASPLYEGHQRLTWFRNRKILDYAPALNPRELDLRNYSYLYADLLASFNHGKMLNINPVTGIQMGSPLAPGIYSEVARSSESGDPSTVGAVSVLEVAQTVRLLQTATAVCTAYQSEYEKGDASDAEAPFDYLENKRFLPIQGAKYFLADKELLAYAERCADDKAFADSAEHWKECGNDPKADYSRMRIEALWKAANNALLFLQNTCLVGRQEPALERLGTSAENPATKIIDFIFQRQSKHLELNAAIAQYGSLTEAIAMQYLSAFTANYPWQECENCGRRFKHSKGTDSHRKPRTVRFCSKSCNVSFFQQKKGAAE